MRPPGDNSLLIANTAFVQGEIGTALTSVLHDRGNYDASTNVFPSTGGSGTAGAIKKGDLWYISVAGMLGGTNNSGVSGQANYWTCRGKSFYNGGGT